MWAFQQNIYKTKSVTVPAPEFTFGTFVVSNTNDVDVYIVNTSDNSIEDKYIDWGDGSPYEEVQGGILISHSYSSTDNYTIGIASDTAGELDDIRELRILPQNGNTTGDVSQVGQFTSLTHFSVQRSQLSGNISSLPTTIINYIDTSTSSTTITGDISSLSNSIENIQIRGNNTLSGSINKFNTSSASIVIIEGSNTISGTLNLTSAINLTSLQIRGNNTITGDIVNLPTSGNLATLFIYGNNTLSGNLSDLFKSYLTNIYIDGDNTITGDVSSSSVYNGNMTTQVRLTILGNNTISGNISNISSAVFLFRVEGANTITGNLSGLPIIVNIASQGSIWIYGNNTISGNLEDALVGKNLSSLIIWGNNIIAGDLGFVDDSVRTVDIQGSNTIGTFTTPATGLNFLYSLTITGNSTFSSTDIDNILIHIASVTDGAPTSNERVVIDSGNNRTSASDAAVATLIGHGFTITINGITE